MSGFSANAMMWGSLLLSVYGAYTYKPSPLPQGEPATDEGPAGPGEVEAFASLPRPVSLFGVTSCDLCGQRITETDAARTGGLCQQCDEDIEFEAGWQR